MLQFLGILETVENPILIHYGSYETIFLKEMLRRYGGPQDSAFKESRSLLKAHRPVDVLFHSLAQQRGPNAIGIILSGRGSDGAKGIQAIKQAGGITFAQDESSTLFFGMPNSAIKTGCVDFVLVPKEIAQKLIRISRH